MKTKLYFVALLALLLSTSAKAQNELSMMAFAGEEKTAAINNGGNIDLNVMMTGGTAPYTLTWTEAHGQTLRTDNIESEPTDLLTLNVTPIVATDYIITLTDAANAEVSDTVRVIVRGESQTADFENLWFDGDEEGEYDYMYGPFYMTTTKDNYGATAYCGSFLSGSFAFRNEYTPLYGSFYGFVYSKTTATDFTFSNYMTDQFNSVVGGACKDDVFAVVFAVAYGEATVDVLSNEDGEQLRGTYITNSAWTYDNIMNGDGQVNETDGLGNSVAGDEGFHKGDWFLVRATGYDKDGVQTGTTDYYLADYRSDNEADHYAVNTWQWMDLSSLGKVSSVTFTTLSSRSNSWGTTTAQYFCIDNFNAAAPATGIQEVKKENNAQWYNLDGTKAKAGSRGIHIVNGKKHFTI